VTLERRTPSARTIAWLAGAWIVFVNAAFYWHFYQARVAELQGIWRRLLMMLQ